MVIARTSGELRQRPSAEDVAVLEVPDSASEPAKAVARTMAARASVRLLSGDSLDFSL